MYGKSVSAFDYLCAIHAGNSSNYIHTDGDYCFPSNSYDSKFPLIRHSQNPETETIKKDLVEKSSKEVKEIIELITYQGDSVSTTIYDKISKTLIKKKLIAQGWTSKKVKHAFQELETLTLELAEV
jgi:hypothetical protein